MESIGDTLPTEALFSLFSSFDDPLNLGAYSLVCKKWFQMSKDNELWRQYCIERWDKNPKESDCVKNWLIPVRETGAVKQPSIDWRRCYTIRYLYDHLHEMSESIERDLFSNGWPTAKDLAKFEKQVEVCYRDLGMTRHILASLDYFFEVELLILRQITASRFKYLGCAAKYVASTCTLLKSFTEDSVQRLVRFASSFTEMALKKDVPDEYLVKMLDRIAQVFIDMMENVEWPAKFYNTYLTEFITAIIKCMVPRLQGSLAQWTSEEAIGKETPTLKFEQILYSISGMLRNNQLLGASIFFAAVLRSIPPSATDKMLIIPKFAALAPVANSFGGLNEQFTTMLMRNLVLPFWKNSDDPEYLVPIIYYFGFMLFDSKCSNIQIDYGHLIIPSLLEMAHHQSASVKYQVAGFVASFCADLDTPEPIVPYFNALLEAMYSYLPHPNSHVRGEAVSAISSLMITYSSSFAQHKERVMTEFKKLLSSADESDRKYVIKALVGIGSVIGDQKSSIETDIEVMYDQVVEGCKRERDAHIDLLLSVTRFAILVLGQKFLKHLDYVFPIIIEHARQAERAAHVVNEATEEDQSSNTHIEVPRYIIERKRSALGTLRNIMQSMDRETFLATHIDIATTLREIITSISLKANTADTIVLAANVLVDYVKQLFLAGDQTWCTTAQMYSYWVNIANMLLETIDAVVSYSAKAQFASSLAKVLEHFCRVGSEKQPFMTDDVVQHLAEHVFNFLLSEFFQAEDQEIPVEQLYDLGYQVMTIMATVCENRRNKESFWELADAVLTALTGEPRELNQYRWIDVCLINVVFDYYGSEFLEEQRMRYLAWIASCIPIRTESMCRVIANHIGIAAKKHPAVLPPVEKAAGLGNSILPYIASLLDPDGKTASTAVYDNALMAMSGLILYLASSYEQCSDPINSQSIRQVLVEYMTILTRAMPPNDLDDLTCVEQYCQVLKKEQVYFAGENGADLKNDVIRALKEILAITDDDDEDIHNIIDPVLETLHALTPEMIDIC